jgi:multiple sugar transport system substrate-binding protein
MVNLTGITWDHPRGLSPMRATAAAFSEQRPDISIHWTPRSLAEFGEQPIEQLATRYDLLVIDHPFAGVAARTGCLLALEKYLPEEFLQELAQQSVGPSFGSYSYDGHQWALPVDAAAQVSAYRADLLKSAGQIVPHTWPDVIELARNHPVAIPLSSAGAIDSFITICASAGQSPGRSPEYFVDHATAERAFDLLSNLVSLVSPESFDLDPPRLLDRMSKTDDIVYCPLLFGYSNYGRPGYSTHLCHFTNIPILADDTAPKSILGGTGIAISAGCRSIDEACAYLKWITSAECQTGIYFQSGGQPGNRGAWLSSAVNQASSCFFLDTLSTLDHAFVRPRYQGFVEFHDQASVILKDSLLKRRSKADALAAIGELYTRSGWES